MSKISKIETDLKKEEESKKTSAVDDTQKDAG